MKKIAIICQGGSLHGGYVAGFLTKLNVQFSPKFSLKDINTYIATSASVGSIFYAISHGDKHPGEQIWTKELADKRFIDRNSPKRLFNREKPFVDVNYMVDNIFKKKFPYDINKIKSSKQKFFFPVTNVKTLKTEFFGNLDKTNISINKENFKLNDFRKEDIYELIKAACAIPIAFDKSVHIEKNDYVDGALYEPLVLDLEYVKDMKKILILTTPQKGKKTFLEKHIAKLWELISNSLPKEIYDIIINEKKTYDHIEERLKELKSDPDTLIIRPKENHKFSGTDNSLEALKTNFNNGIEKAKENHETLKKFLEIN